MRGRVSCCTAAAEFHNFCQTQWKKTDGDPGSVAGRVGTVEEGSSVVKGSPVVGEGSPVEEEEEGPVELEGSQPVEAWRSYCRIHRPSFLKIAN